MLYTNTTLTAEERQMSFGPLWGIPIGERGRGRWEEFIPCPKSIETLGPDNHHEFHVTTTRNGTPRITRDAAAGAFAILSSQGGYTRRGDGFVAVQKPVDSHEANVTVMGKAWGADGAAGRIGQWTVVVLKLPDSPVLFRVRRSGDNPSDLVHWNGTECRRISNGEIEHYFDYLDRPIPFCFNDRKFEPMEWVTL